MAKHKQASKADLCGEQNTNKLTELTCPTFKYHPWVLWNAMKPIKVVKFIAEADNYCIHINRSEI